MIAQAKKLGWAIASIKVITVPTATTNITGFFRRHPRVELAKGPAERLDEDLFVEEATSLRHPVGHRPGCPIAPRRYGGDTSAGNFRSVHVVGPHLPELPVAQLFDDRAERDGREEGQAADYQDHADHEPDEHGVVSTEGPERSRHEPLAASDPPRARAGMMMPNRPISMSMAPTML